MKKEIDLYDVFVGEYFTNLRIEHRYTQEQISDLIGAPRSTYCGYERGTRELPIKYMKKLCTLYHLNFYKTFEYLDREGEKRGIR